MTIKSTPVCNIFNIEHYNSENELIVTTIDAKDIDTLEEAADYAEREFYGEWETITTSIILTLTRDEYMHIEIADEDLKRAGYTEIIEQDATTGTVLLRSKSGEIERFAIRDDYAGYTIPTKDGRVLEFTDTIVTARN